MEELHNSAKRVAVKEEAVTFAMEMMQNVSHAIKKRCGASDPRNYQPSTGMDLQEWMQHLGEPHELFFRTT